MAEAQYRLGKRKGFTTVYREVAQDSRLSLKARGLFLLMQSLPDDWKFTIAGLATKSGAGVKQIRKALKELEDVGYLVREQSHADNGTFAGNVWILQEEAPPLVQKGTTAGDEKPPLCQKALTPLALAEKGTLNNTILTNTPLTPQGEKACVCCEDGNDAVAEPNAEADADSVADDAPADTGAVTDTGAANANAVAEHPADIPRAVTSRCARPRSAPKWKPERFERFWQFYSANVRSENRQGAVRAWDKLKPNDDLINLMGWALMQQLKSDTWKRGIGLMYASSWLNGRRWEDVLDAAPANPAPEETEVSGWAT